MSTGTVPVTAGSLGVLPEATVAAGTESGRATYVYDLGTLRRRCEEVAALPIRPKRVHFATMANDHPRVIECVARCGHGVFVNSRRHLQVALRSGVDASRILYAASNMVADEMRLCASLGVRVVLDSVEQVRSFGAVAGGGAVGLRVSIGVADGDVVRPDAGYRFGILPEELEEAVEAAAERGVSIEGVHSYFGTDLPAAPLVHGVGQLTRVAERLPDLAFVDAGGGFSVGGADEPWFDLDRYGSGIARHMADLRDRVGREIEFVVEPGRYLAASCGHFFVTVVDVKARQDRVFVGTNGSVAVFPRPLLYPDRAFHPCGVLGRDPDEPADPRPIWVCGNSTYSQDFLARGIRLPLPRVGDVLVFGNAGAYCRSMVSRFLGKDQPAEVVLDGAQSWNDVEELDLLGEAG
jgi:diaminopimelate decarboxylase